MDCSKLYPGQIFPNYTALCKWLDVPAKTGGSKTTQMDDWKSHYFEWFKPQGKNEIHILEVFDPPKPRKPSKHQKKYQDSVTYSLLSYILGKTEPREELRLYRIDAEKSRGEEIDFNNVFLAEKNLWQLDYGLERKDIYINLWLCNENYYKYFGNNSDLYYMFNDFPAMTEIEASRFDPDILEKISASALYKDFYEVAYNVMYDIVDSIFKHLEKSRMAIPEKCFEIKDAECSILNFKKATSEQHEQIAEVRNKMLIAYKCKSIGGVVVTNRYKDFIDDVDKYLNEKYKITSHREVVNFKAICDLRDAFALYQDKFESYEQASAYTNKIVSETILEKMLKKYPKDREQIVELVDFLIAVKS